MGRGLGVNVYSIHHSIDIGSVALRTAKTQGFPALQRTLQPGLIILI